MHVLKVRGAPGGAAQSGHAAEGPAEGAREGVRLRRVQVDQECATSLASHTVVRYFDKGTGMRRILKFSQTAKPKLFSAAVNDHFDRE